MIHKNQKVKLLLWAVCLEHFLQASDQPAKEGLRKQVSIFIGQAMKGEFGARSIN